MCRMGFGLDPRFSSVVEGYGGEVFGQVLGGEELVEGVHLSTFQSHTTRALKW